MPSTNWKLQGIPHCYFVADHPPQTLHQELGGAILDDEHAGELASLLVWLHLAATRLPGATAAATEIHFPIKGRKLGLA